MIPSNPLKDYQQRVPIGTYEDMKPYINRLMEGEQNLLWPSEIKWFAKSSGTTSDKSKFIPVSDESLEDCHFRGGKDVIAFYMKQNAPITPFSKGKGLTLGGSAEVNKFSNESYLRRPVRSPHQKTCPSGPSSYAHRLLK
jgi:hypothetical protein